MATEGRIGDDGIEALVEVLWTLEGVLVFDVKFLVMDPVHDEVHAAQVVGGWRHLLAVKRAHFFHFLRHAQQQRTRTARGVVDAAQAGLARGHDFGQNAADFLRRIKLTGLLARIAGKLPNEVFVRIAQQIAF